MGISLRNRVVLALVVLACALVVLTATRARSAESHCDRNAAASAARARQVSGTGPRVVVIGDSYSAGWGLDDPGRSWPSALDGEVHVDGFSGSGFSADASSCAGVAYADRAGGAVAGGASLVLVQGGLNDVDQPTAEVRDGVRRLLGELRGYDVVLVGPPAAPSRARAVGRIDALLAAEATRARVRYLPMLDVDLAYLDDDLHLTEAGHLAFGRAVARELAAR